MKGKLYFTILLIPVLFIQLEAQITFPDASERQKWEYVTWNFWGGHCEKRIIKNGQNKNICEGAYIEIFDCDVQEKDCHLLGYYRIKGDSIVIRRVGYWNGQKHVDSADCNKPFGLIYDFGSQINDSLECALNDSYDPFLKKFWVVDIQKKEYQGIERVTRTLNYLPYPNIPNAIFTMKWIDGIGSNVHPFYSLGCIGDHCEHEQQLTKVYRNDQLIYVDTVLRFSFPCVPRTSIPIDYSDISDVTIYPNPTTHSFKIQSKSTDEFSIGLKVYNHLGECMLTIKSMKRDQSIDVSNLKPGVYLVNMHSNEHIIYRKLIKH